MIAPLAVFGALVFAGCSSSPATFQVNIVVVGDGTVAAIPGGNCVGPRTCPVKVSAPETIVLSGAPAPGWSAATWMLSLDTESTTLPVQANGTVSLQGTAGTTGTLTVTFAKIGGAMEAGRD